MSWDDGRPNLKWRAKTYLRNRRWNKYWDWEKRANEEHVAVIASYKPMFVETPPAGDGSKTCKFCGREGSRHFTQAGQGTWRCTAIKACVARSTRRAA